MRLASLHFTGPREKTWVMPVDLDEPDESLNFKIHQSIKSNSGIVSRDWEWEFDHETLKGEIWVGPGRLVGSIEARLLEVPA